MSDGYSTGSKIMLVVVVVVAAVAAAFAAALLQQFLLGRTYTGVTGGVVGAVVAVAYISMTKKRTGP